MSTLQADSALIRAGQEIDKLFDLLRARSAGAGIVAGLAVRHAAHSSASLEAVPKRVLFHDCSESNL
jgi:hypothetical protein